MFDAKALLDQLARSATEGSSADARAAHTGASGGLNDLLGQLSAAVGQKSAGTPAGTGPAGGGLSDLIARIQETAGGAAGAGGGLAETLKNVLAQSTGGLRDAANDSGLSAAARTAAERVSGGQTPDDLIARVKALVSENQLATGAVLGGIGGLLLGTKTGRNMAEDAAKLGAAALIGGLAYKAYQNYRSGKPLIGAASDEPVRAAPAGSGFEPEAMSNEAATRIIRAMIAAAAADGRIDEAESGRILAAFRKSGADKEAEAFLMREVAQPSSAAALAEGVGSEAEAMEIYAAARLAVELDTPAEQAFLAELAERLKLDKTLVAHLDAAAKGTTAAA